MQTELHGCRGIPQPPQIAKRRAGSLHVVRVQAARRGGRWVSLRVEDSFQPILMLGFIAHASTPVLMVRVHYFGGRPGFAPSNRLAGEPADSAFFLAVDSVRQDWLPTTDHPHGSWL